MVMTLLGRQLPECEPSLTFSDSELEFLGACSRKYGPPNPDSLRPTIGLVANLGGYRGRKHDPEPGHQLMWHGYNTLTKATLGHQIARERDLETVTDR